MRRSLADAAAAVVKRVGGRKVETLDGLTSRAQGKPNELITMWRVCHRMGRWVGVVVGESGRGRMLGRVEGQSYTSHKFSAACGLRHAVGCELCPPDCTPDQLGRRTRKSSTVSSSKAVWSAWSQVLGIPWLLHGWRAGAAAGCLDVAVLAFRSL